MDKFIEKVETPQDKILGMKPYTVLFREALLEAYEKRASDIHIESQEEDVLIRFRVHGVLSIWKSLKSVHQLAFLREVKSLTDFPIATSGTPLDSSVYFPKWKLKLRGSLLPGIYGENLVFRLIDLNKLITLENRGFDEKTTKTLRNLTKLKDGLVIISGATGSGKSSTLNAILKEFPKEKVKIITIEDPDEYPIEGALQVKVGGKMSFASALRASMRQDPNVILIGEIRDKETAQIAIEAAATGHLVFSTIHASSAKEVRERLIETLGVDESLLSSVLRFTSNQKFEAIICNKTTTTIGRKPLLEFLSL